MVSPVVHGHYEGRPAGQTEEILFTIMILHGYNIRSYNPCVRLSLLSKEER